MRRSLQCLVIFCLLAGAGEARAKDLRLVVDVVVPATASENSSLIVGLEDISRGEDQPRLLARKELLPVAPGPVSVTLKLRDKALRKLTLLRLAATLHTGRNEQLLGEKQLAPSELNRPLALP